MDRFVYTGSGIATPLRHEAELRAILAKFGVSETADEVAVHEVYLRLAVIIGKWFSEEDRVAVKPVAKALLRISKDLTEACQLMSGFETGFRNSFEITVTRQLRTYLALDPTVGRNAQELVGSLRQQAAQIAHACMVGYTDLSGEAGNLGRLALGWYDDFTALLLELAGKAGVEPKNTKDRNTGIRSGWLFDLAMALETFFYPEMRSPSAEACGKRLERSRTRLKAGARQKPPRR